MQLSLMVINKICWRSGHPTDPHSGSMGVCFANFVNPHQPTYTQTLEVYHFCLAMPDSRGCYSVMCHIRFLQVNFSALPSFADPRFFSIGTSGFLIGLRGLLVGTDSSPPLRRLLIMITGPQRGPVIIINNHCPWRTDILALLSRSPPSLMTKNDYNDHAIQIKGPSGD